MAIRTLFVTRLYEAMIDNPALIEELEHSVRMLAAEDRAGQGWSKARVRGEREGRARFG